jgi:hypothetical protein
VLDILGVRSGSNTVHAVKQVDVERTQKADIATPCFSIKQEKTMTALKRRQEDQMVQTAYGSGKH